MIETATVYLTQERLIELERDLKELKTNGRKEIARKIAEARAHGDLSENAEYDAAKEEQGLFELKVSKLEAMISRATIIDTTKYAKDTVHILAKVKIRNVKTKAMMNYELVSPEEADFKIGKIAITSPVGASLMGKKIGEIVKAKVPAGVLELEILEIE